MATLTKENPFSSSSATAAAMLHHELDASVPTPFPKDLMQELRIELAAEDLQLESASQTSRSETPIRPTILVPPVEAPANREVGPSLTHVSQLCLMTLNNLLSQDAHTWQPIVPIRRHSLPAQSPISPSSNVQALFTSPSSSSALHILVTNLRHRDDPEMRDVSANGDTSLLVELTNRVKGLIDRGAIQPRDAHLAESLISLLTHLNRLSGISPEPLHRSPVDAPQPPSATNIYDTLRRQVSELQSHRDAHVLLNPDPSASRPPIQVVEHAVIWNRIDNDLDEVFRLCRERTDTILRPSSPNAPSLPPSYDVSDYEPPSYDPTEYSETAAAKASHNQLPTSSFLSQQSQSTLDEKMRLDLEAVTMAIDRLYLVAPQLSNQRVELKRAKLEQMEQARASGGNIAAENSVRSAAKRKGKAKEAVANNVGAEDVRDLERMLELIGKASMRRIEGQSVVLDDERGMAERAEKARLRDLEKRDAFHERLVTHSNARRLTSQDAILHKASSIGSLVTRTKNPDALLTLPEFIREAIPDSVEQARDPDALLTLPEFVREPPPGSSSPESSGNLTATSSSKFMKPFRPSRNRSLSAPPLALAWFLSGSTPNIRSPSPLAEEKLNTTSHANGYTNGRSSPLRAGLDIQYVAEHQEGLGSVVVFLQVNGKEAGIDIQAEVFPSGGERLIVKCGASTSSPLGLPARVLPGKKEVKVQSGHFEVKLECTAPQPNGHGSFGAGECPESGLLGAAQLQTLNPTTFICASCSLPLVQSSRLSRYDDLPSEHWAELLDAWMCHSDQKLTNRVATYANGLWPRPGQALVGGSYVLFESSSVVMNNIRARNQSATQNPDDWQPVHCLCGAVAGRCRQHTSSSETALTTTYRLPKYAIRPVSSSSEPMKIPLSAFILQDMDELVHAHAAYRFVLLDEENEKPRILMWMFKPHIRISYATSNHYFMARSASIQAAKVHFKVLGPSVSPTLKSTMEKYPGFEQSERLLYPLDICRRLAGLLKESNAAYPQGRRVMGGLDVGWLLRV